MSAMMIETPAWYWTAEPCTHTLCSMNDGSCCQFSGRRWDQSAAAMAKPHTLLECNGRCKQPFHTVDAIRFAYAEKAYMGWGDMIYLEEEMMHAKETPAQAAAKEAARAARMVQEKVDAEARKMATYMREMEIKRGCKGEQQKPKVPLPCKYLYCTPGKEGVYQNNLCSECWGYEYHCPKTGELLKAKKGKECDRLHPGEAGWLPQWNTDRHFKPAGQAKRDFSGLGGATKPNRR